MDYDLFGDFSIVIDAKIWSFGGAQLQHDAAKGPNVRCEADLAVKLLRAHVPVRPCFSNIDVLNLSVIILWGYSQIDDFNLGMLQIEDDVFRFQIPVYNLLLVQIAQSWNQLPAQHLGLLNHIDTPFKRSRVCSYVLSHVLAIEHFENGVRLVPILDGVISMDKVLILDDMRVS